LGRGSLVVTKATRPTLPNPEHPTLYTKDRADFFAPRAPQWTKDGGASAAATGGYASDDDFIADSSSDEGGDDSSSDFSVGSDGDSSSSDSSSDGGSDEDDDDGGLTPAASSARRGRPAAAWAPAEEAAFLDAAAKHGRRPSAISGAYRVLQRVLLCFGVVGWWRGSHAHTKNAKPKSALSLFGQIYTHTQRTHARS
jgi:hypothetical protein